MKKIFKIASLLFCAGALVVYTGCTKESSSGDVAELTKKVDNLSEQLNSQAAQITSLQGVVKQLESAQKTLESDIAALKQAKVDLENKKADKTQVEALEAEINELEKLAEQNKKDIENIQETIKGLATQKYVDATFATLKKVEEVEGNLGKLQATVDNINEVVIPKIKKEIGDIQTDISQLKTSVKDAAAAAQSALGKIAVIEKTLQDVYLKGQVDAAIESAKKELNETINAKVKELQEKDALLQTEIDKQTVQIKGLISAVDSKADTAEVNKIKADLAALQKKVDESVIADVSELLKDIKNIKIQIAGLAGRVTSIVACPTLTEEFITLIIGNQSAKVLCADFEIKPADKVDEIVNAFKDKKSPVSLRYSYARSRSVTKASVSEIAIKTAAISDIRKNDNGTIRVIANCIESAPSSVSLFYSLAYEGEDAASEYAVISDYTEAIKGGDFVLDTLVQYAAIDAAEKITFLAAHDKDYVHETSYNYKAADTVTHQPWVSDTLAFNPNVNMDPEKKAVVKKIFNEDAYTLAEVTELTGIDFYVSLSVADYKIPVTVYSGQGFNTTFHFVPEQGKKMYEYVKGSPYDAKHTYMVNTVLMPGSLIEQYFITKIEHAAVQLPDTTIYWNYKHYWNAHRHVTVDFSKARKGYDPSTWNEALDKSAEVTKGFVDDQLLRYKDIATGYQPLTVSIDSAYYEYNNVYKKDTHVVNECVKESESDKYTFNIKTYVKKALIKDVAAEKQTITGSITKPDTVVIKNFVDLYIKTSKGAIEPSLIQGLAGDDILYANVQAAFIKQFEASPYTILSGAKDITSEVTASLVSKKDLKLIVNAGIFGYSENAVITLKYENIFGRMFTVAQPIATTAPKFGLGTKNWIDPKTKIGTAIGAFKGDVYTLEDMFYNKQVELTNSDNLNKYESVIDDDVIVKFTVTPTTEGATGIIGNQKGAAGINVNVSDGSLYEEKLTWGDYNGLEFKVAAQLFIKEMKVGDPVQYTIQTKKPVRYVSNTHDAYSRKPAEDLPIVLYKKAVVYGIVNNEEVAKNIVNADGTISKYPETEFEYAEPKDWTVTLNGEKPTSWVAGVDYDWDKDKATITIKGDNLQGELKITVGSKLHHYLDANQPQELPISLTVNSAKNN